MQIQKERGSHFCSVGFVYLTLVFFIIAGCSDDKSSGSVDSQVPIQDKSISGVSEKGPFVKGTAVKLYELKYETLGQTGRAFTSKIDSDKGDFRFSHIDLESQYVLMEAEGYYRNEVTGVKSKAPITLNALVDVSDKESANINLLTHLAYERTQYLVGEGESVREAKKQAEHEILKAFLIDDETIDGFEELSIFESGKGNEALLAISILMQGDLSEGDFSERLANFAYDVEEDGVWDDGSMKVQIADWASLLSSIDYYASIRGNVEGWSLSDTVPAFEKSLDEFWWKSYGLGECNKEREGEIAENKNKESQWADVSFKCKNNLWARRLRVDQWNAYDDSGDGGQSVISMKIENDTIKVSTEVGYFLGWDFVGVTFNPSDVSEWVDYSACKGITYSYKGMEHHFVILSPLLSETSEYRKRVAASNEWKRTTVYWSGLEYYSWEYEIEPITNEEVRKQVAVLGWEFYETGSFELTDVECVPE